MTRPIHRYTHMTRGLLVRLTTAAAALVVAAGCTMKNQDPPPFSGPAEFGTSITIQVSPDVLTQDGASQSVVTVVARDPDNQPIRNLPLRAEIYVDGVLTDFGALSARNVVTGSDGRASLVYTAPASIPNSPDTNTVVNILVTPSGTDFNTAVARTAAIRLVPQGTVPPPAGLQPSFTFSPSNPTESQNVLFDASESRSTTSAQIVSYAWDFGDSRTGSGQTTTHAYSAPGTYFVRLTLTDSFGRSASTTRTVVVGQGTAPSATFVFSPTNSTVGTTVNFNASASRPASGRQIVSYTWDFGNGTIQTTSSPTISHVYTSARTYTVTLVVTDDIGRTATFSATITIAP